MSEHPPGHTTPSLPLELCFNILEYATLVPNAFDTHTPDAFAYPAPLSQEEIQEGIRASLRTKRHIVLVCKAWNSYGTRLLYQAIPTPLLSTLRKVLRTLNDSANTNRSSDTNEDSKGRLTIRLDIHLISKPYPFEPFSELLPHFPNLQIVTFRGPLQVFLWQRTEPKTFFDLLAMHQITTLKMLDFLAYNDSYYYPFSLDVLDGLPLRFLRIRPPSLPLIQPRTPIRLPDLEYLDVPSDLLEAMLAGNTAIQSLSHLCVDGARGLRWQLFNATQSGMGACLSSLEIDQCPLIAGETSGGQAHALRKLHEVYPNLEELIVDFGMDNHVNGMYFWKLPSVKKLGLRLRGKVDQKELFWGLARGLERLKSNTPSLKIVRVLSHPSGMYLKICQRKAFEIAQNLSAHLILEHNLRLEDCSGRLFYDYRLEYEEDFS